MISSILSTLDSLYPEYKQTEKELECCKKSLKHHYDNSLSNTHNEPLIHKGVRLHYKRKTKKTWQVDDLHEELSQLNIMHMAKKITKHHLSFLQPSSKNASPNTDFTSFLLPTEQYVRPYIHRRSSQTIDNEKVYFAELEQEFKELPLDELLFLYQQYKTSYKQLDTLYKSTRNSLFSQMKKLNALEIDSNVGLWKITTKPEQYDLLALGQQSYSKQLTYTFSLSQNDLFIHDHFSKEKRTVSSNQFYMNEHDLSFTPNGFFIDNHCISPLTIPTIKERLQIDSTPSSSLTIKGNILLSGDTFLRQLPISNTKVDDLITKGFLHPSILSNMRYVQSFDDISTYFEVIEESSHISRLEQHARVTMNRAQTLRQLNENAKHVLTALYD